MHQKQYKSLQNKKLALNHALIGFVILAVAVAAVLWQNNDKYRNRIEKLKGRVQETEMLIELKEIERERLIRRLDSLKNEVNKVDTVEIETIKYYEVKKNEILADSADADLREVRSFLRAIELPNR